MDKLAKWCIWLRRRSFFRVAQRTFAVLMPIATVGAFFQVLQYSVFAPESFIYNLFDFDKIMSDRFWDIGTRLSQCVVEVIFAFFACSRFISQLPLRLKSTVKMRRWPGSVL